MSKYEFKSNTEAADMILKAVGCVVSNLTFDVEPCCNLSGSRANTVASMLVLRDAVDEVINSLYADDLESGKVILAHAERERIDKTRLRQLILGL